MGINSVPKFIFRLSRFPVYRGSVLGRFYCTYLLEKVLKMISLYVSAFCARCSILSILRIDTAELHRVYDNMLQRAQNCNDVQGDNLQPFSNQ